MTIKEMAVADRPREKLLKYGPGKLTNSELLATLLRTGVKGENVVELSGRILKRYNSRQLAVLSASDLDKAFGLGPAKACEIVACFELGKRLLKDKKTELFFSPRDVRDSLKDIRSHKKEHFAVFYLDTRNQEIKREVISVGTLNANLVHPREVFEPAIACHSAQIIVAHNHPSGYPEPSEEDLHVTKRLTEAGGILGIELLDHIIITRDSFLSFKERSLL